MEGRAGLMSGGMLRMFQPGMRAYFVPLVAGVVLVVSTTLPWVIVEDTMLRGLPEVTGLWVAGLGGLAAALAALSLITRKNSRHPILLVGLTALGIMFLSWRLMPRVASDRAMTRSQALAIVENRPVPARPQTRVGIGIYLGLVASFALVCFGLTIVIRRASSAYVVTPTDDDV